MRKLLPILLVVVFALIISACQKSKPGDTTVKVDPPKESVKSFKNPIINGDHADPFVAQKDGYYYFLYTRGNSISITKTSAMSQLATATDKVVWTPAGNTEYSVDVWVYNTEKLTR